jgi:hypothetical protein
MSSCLRLNTDTGAAAEGRALELIRRQLGAARELPTATDRFRESSDKASRVLIVLAAVLVLLTVTLMGATGFWWYGPTEV